MKNNESQFSLTRYRLSRSRREVVFNYQLAHRGRLLTFAEKISLPKPVPLDTPRELLDRVLTSVHLVLGVSYYKTYCPRNIRHSYQLNQAQAEYWSVVYQHGLGEFCYRNHIDPRTIAKIRPSGRLRITPVRFPRRRRALLGVGGGKDSIVAGEWLRQIGWTPTAFVAIARHSPLIDQVIKKMALNHYAIRRIIDPQLLRQLPESYSGHIPVSATYSWLGFLAALAGDYRYVLVGNEFSSNAANVRWKGFDINHQWSKSSEFESATQSYIRQWVTPDIEYASVLRPYYELRLLQAFSQYPKYFQTFSSCNRHFRLTGRQPHQRWCGDCPKCAFTFLGLAAFLPKKTLLRIFGKYFLDQPNLLPIYRDLLGYGHVKPWECVGTFEENRVALSLAAKKFPQSLAVRTYIGRAKIIQPFKTDVFQRQKTSTLPLPFELLGVRTAVVLGYGQEGRATQQWLRKRYPWIKTQVRDQQQGRTYLQNLSGFDLAIKTPGLPGRRVTIPYTTATNIFFGAVENQIIGVTGSKGKSTTASLINHILTSASLGSELLGNIGRPMLARLLRPVNSSTIFVLELSSYQLEDLRDSPEIAVFLNFFPEHLDYHGSLSAYAAAKENITRFQRPSDVYVYNPQNAFTRQVAHLTAAQAIPFSLSLPLSSSAIPLLGRHNLDNVRAAVTVARRLGVPDQRTAQAIKTFRPLPHRLQIVGTFRDITFVDDAISTTPESTIAALQSLPRTRTIFLGGTDRGYTFTRLERALRRFRVQNIVLFPDTGKRILRSKKGFTFLHTRSMQQAVKFAYQHAPANSICLLSCASPSYSLWKNFEAKGDEFQHWVKRFGEGSQQRIKQ